jgi:hypothetical protein
VIEDIIVAQLKTIFSEYGVIEFVVAGKSPQYFRTQFLLHLFLHHQFLKDLSQFSHLPALLAILHIHGCEGAIERIDSPHVTFADDVLHVVTLIRFNFKGRDVYCTQVDWHACQVNPHHTILTLNDLFHGNTDFSITHKGKKQSILFGNRDGKTPLVITHGAISCAFIDHKHKGHGTAAVSFQNKALNEVLRQNACREKEKKKQGINRRFQWTKYRNDE